ncbi:MAG: protease complex subunit PrcB family protein [Planctomycetota bacterium]|nr:protease complex subunit PrcB family protein [Planctomycetota bacterium]
MEAVEIVLAVLQIIGAVQWTPEHKKAEQLVFRSADEMAAVWMADGGKKEHMPQRYNEVGEIRVFDEGAKKDQPPGINFEKEMVLAVFAGEKPTGGHSVKIEKVVYGAAKKTVWVIYREKAPEPGAGVTQALTYPSHVVAVKKVEGEVRFVKAGTKEAALVEDMLQKTQPVKLK